jgi:16S rRNA processing protein RimM
MGAPGDRGRATQPVVLGVIARPHGVRGEVRMRPYNPGSTVLWSVAQVCLCAPDGSDRTVALRAARGTPDSPILALEGVEGREAAEALKGTEVAVPRSALPSPEPDEWYVVDLIGLRVTDPGGTVVGEVEDVISYPSIDCLRVRSEGGVREVPMTEPWFQGVDLDAGEVHVGPLDDVPGEAT